MFVAQAHSFRQQARLAITLSWIAGYTNILTILLCGQVTSHVSGSASQLGRDVVEQRWGSAGYLLGLLVVFFAGAALSGFLTETGHRRRWSSIYVVPMVVEATLLATFALLVDWNAEGGLEATTAALWLTLLPAFAMGLQNATITRISGGVVRTTHVTGVVTDLGLEGALWVMGRFGRRKPVVTQGRIASGWRLVMLLSILGSFAFGSASGTLMFEHAPRWAMVPAVALALWLVAVDLWHPIADILSNRDVGGDLYDVLPPQVAAYHIEVRPSRLGRTGRMPNLSAWVEHLPADIRVVLLDVSDVETMNENEVLEMSALAETLQRRQTSLVIAGVTPQRYEKFKRAGITNIVHRFGVHVCGDLDLAAARAMTLLDEHEVRH